MEKEKQLAVEEGRKPRPMCEIAKPGDPQPKMPKGMTGSWLQNHFNVRYGTEIAIRLEPERWALCTLHMHLRICGAMLERSVFRQLSEKDGRAGMGGKSVAQKLFEFLCFCGLRISQVKAPKANVDLYYSSLTRHSFCGSEADAVCLLWKEILDIVYPEEERKKRSVGEKYDRAFKMWQCYTEKLWPLICKQGMDREVKAEQVQKLALEFTEFFVECCGATEHLYIHMLNAHLPDQIRTFPVDITKFQTSGLEHGHKMRKQWASAMISHIQSVPGATKTVSSYVRNEGTDNAVTVASYMQRVGFSRIHQLLRNETVQNTLFKQLLTSDGHFKLAEDAKKNVRAQRRARNCKTEDKRDSITSVKMAGPAMPPALQTCK